jgi:hypothetical protein
MRDIAGSKPPYVFYEAGMGCAPCLIWQSSIQAPSEGQRLQSQLVSGCAFRKTVADAVDPANKETRIF